MTRRTMNPRLLNGLIVASAMLTIAAAPWALDLSVLAFVFKPLTTVLIIVLAWPRGADKPAARRALRIGLLLSLLGDIALLWPQQGFLPGLVAFLLAHIAYIVAFTREHRFLAQPAALTALRAGRRRDPGAAVAVDAAGVARAGGVLRAGAHRDGGADGGGGLGRAGRRAQARPLADAGRRVVHGVRRAAGHQQVRAAAAGGEPVDPRHLLGGAVVHRVVAQATRTRVRHATG